MTTAPENQTSYSPVCDCLPRVREYTLAREKRYRERPDLPSPEGPQSFIHVQVTSMGDLNEEAMSLKSGRTWIISEPTEVGGIDNAPTPLEYLLSGAIGCYSAVFAFYAAKLGVSYDAFQVKARVDFDKRGHMIEDAPPSGFKNLRLEVKVTSDASPEQLAEVQQLALQGCPGISTLRDPVNIAATDLIVEATTSPSPATEHHTP